MIHLAPKLLTTVHYTHTVLLTSGKSFPLTITAVIVPFGGTEETCEAPDITNVATKKLSGGVVMVTWDYSRINGRGYCPGSRRFRVAARSYDTYDKAVADTALLTGNFDYRDAGRRTNEYNATEVDYNLFYRFYVQTPRSEKIRTSTGYTAVQHFGEVGEWMATSMLVGCFVHYVTHSTLLLSSLFLFSLPPSLPPSLSSLNMGKSCSGAPHTRRRPCLPVMQGDGHTNAHPHL